MPDPTRTTDLRRYFLPVLCIAVAMAAVLIRIRFLPFALERDEGEYAYMGSLILDGIAPYAESYNMKMPGIYAIYALVMATFGETVSGIRTGLILFSLTSTVFVFLIARHWFGRTGAWLALGIYSIASLLPGVQGMSANAEQFLLPFSLAGVWLIITRPASTAGAILAGVLMGTAMVVKQHGALFTGFAGLYFLFIAALPLRQRLVQTILFGCGALVPLCLTFVVMLSTGVLDSFLFWTVEYALAYASQVPVTTGLKILLLRLVTMIVEAPLLWFAFAAGLVCILRERTDRYAPLVLLAVSLLATMPGFFFRPHYFILLMPVISVIAAAGILFMSRRWNEAGAIAGFALLIAMTLLPARHLLITAPLDDVSRAVFGANPFAASGEIAAYIRANTREDEKIAVIGSEPQLYFLSGRRAATGYIYTYALMEDHPFAERMQREMIQEIETAAPAMIAYINVPNSWLVQPGSSRTIFNWTAAYQQQHYTLVGQVLLGPGGATYQFDDALPETVNPQRVGIYVFRRR